MQHLDSAECKHLWKTTKDKQRGKRELIVYGIDTEIGHMYEGKVFIKHNPVDPEIIKLRKLVEPILKIVCGIVDEQYGKHSHITTCLGFVLDSNL